MSVFKDIRDSISSFLKNEMKIRQISEEKLRDLISDRRDELNAFLEGFNIISKKDYGELYDLYMEKSGLDGGNGKNRAASMYDGDVLRIFEHYRFGLKDKAKSMENANPFSTVAYTASVYIDILNDIEKNINRVIQERDKNTGITLKSVKVSTSAFIGILEGAKHFANFSFHLLGFVTYIVTDERVKYPGYRIKKMQNNVAVSSSIASQLCNKRGIFYFVQQAKKIKTKGFDMRLYDEADQGSGVSMDGFIVGGLPDSFMQLFTLFLRAINVFAWVPEKFEKYRFALHKRREQRREWLKTRLQLAKARIDKHSDDDPEYANKVKIAIAYDRQITHLDKDINEYLEED